MAGFSIYPRKNKKGRIYYVQFKKDDGSYTVAKSTKCTTRRDAMQWCEDYLTKHGIPVPGHDAVLSEYAKDFFSWSGRWATSKRVEGKRISERHCRDRADIMRIHVLPVFGSLKLSEIDKIRIRNYRNDLYQQGYSGSVINKCLYALKTILEDAEDNGFIKAVPKIIRAANNTKQKGILTIDEVNQLFSVEWSRRSLSDTLGFTGNLVAASTGLRLGELQAIKLREVNLDDGYITIKQSWDNRMNKLNATTKTGRERNIFIPHRVVEAIKALLAIHPHAQDPEAFLFWGEKKSLEKPAEKAVFTRSLYSAMKRIGINDEERKRRNITFHSWRHFLNSLLINAKIPIQKVQSITGHITIDMTQYYYHTDDMQDVRNIQESIFSDRQIEDNSIN